MATKTTLLEQIMKTKEQQFIKALGTHIAQLRQKHGLTQQALADDLGIAQQTLAHYEVGRLRMPVTLLPEFSRLFVVPVDELLGLNNAKGKSKRGPAPKLQQQIERLSRLPKAKQQVVIDMLEGVLQQAG